MIENMLNYASEKKIVGSFEILEKYLRLMDSPGTNSLY